MFQEITEKTFDLNEPIVQLVFGEVLCKDPHYDYARMVYLKTKKPKIITAGLFYNEHPKKESGEFKTLLSPQFQFNECLLLSTLYYFQATSVIENILYQNNLSESSAINSILKSTNGFIVFAYQFEQIAQLILGIRNDDAIKLRKAFNKLPNCIYHMNINRIHIQNFERILKQHMITESVHQPNYQGAANLMYLYER